MTLLDPVVLLVIAFQVVIFLRCNVIARADESEELDRLWNTFKHDIQSRAKRGDGPDWVRYMDEADRVHERRVDRMRVWATAALVVGIGGTMAALAFRLDPEPDALSGLPALDANELLTAFGPALLASLFGVLNNLAITLWLFRRSDGGFEQALNGFRQALQTCSAENAPQERFADAVRDQLGEAFRQAVRSFPEAFARLDRSVQHMVDSAAEQSQMMIDGAASLEQGVGGLTAAAERIAPVAELLNTATAELRAVPGELGRTLGETREAWAQEMRRDQDAFIGGVERMAEALRRHQESFSVSVGQVLDEQRAILDRTRQALRRWERGRREAAEQQQAAWRETVALVQQAAEQIVATAEGLPAAFSREITQISGELGQQFGVKAQQHVADLTQELREGNKALAGQIETSTRELQNRLLNDTKQVVGDSAEEVHRRVGEPLLTMLQRVSRGIEEALDKLPENAETFAASLSAADEKLRQAIARLQLSADHLERAADVQKNFQSSLAGAFRDGAADSFRPVRNNLQDVVSELRRVTDSHRVTHRGFFRRLFDRLRRRRSAGGPTEDAGLGLR